MTTSMQGIFTKNDYAYFRLRELILTGVLAPGAQIQQGQLAQEIGVSTTPLREAIRRLAAEGLVNLAAHRDARVADATPEEARDVYEVRAQLDPMAAALAARKRTEGDLTAITDAEDKLVPLTGGDGIDALMAHREFHRAIYMASHNNVLIDLLERLWDKADRYRLIGLRSRGDSVEETARVAKEHHDLVCAIRGQDEDAAREIMHAHIANSLGRSAIGALSKQNPADGMEGPES